MVIGGRGSSGHLPWMDRLWIYPLFLAATERCIESSNSGSISCKKGGPAPAFGICRHVRKFGKWGTPNPIFCYTSLFLTNLMIDHHSFHFYKIRLSVLSLLHNHIYFGTISNSLYLYGFSCKFFG